MAYRTSPRGTYNMRLIREEDNQLESDQELFMFEQYGSHLIIKTNIDQYGLVLTDISGRVVLNSHDMVGTTQYVDLTGLSNGIYIVKCYSGTHQETVKILVSQL